MPVQPLGGKAWCDNMDVVRAPLDADRLAHRGPKVSPEFMKTLLSGEYDKAFNDPRSQRLKYKYDRSA